MTQRASWVSWRKQNGFTIVELLIVIVVIAILAVITIVAYSGITARTENASKRADINALMKQSELFRVEKDKYPRVSYVTPSDPAPELEKMLRATGLYEDTRQVDGKTKRAFVFCTSPDTSVFTVVAKPREFDQPLPSGGILADRVGTPMIYSTNGVMGESPFAVDPLLAGNVGANMCKSIHPQYDTGWQYRWSFDVPTAKAP